MLPDGVLAELLHGVPAEGCVMAWTERELLERVPSFTEQERRRAAEAAARATPTTAPDGGACDSCGEPVTEPGRFRHASCPVPPLPPSAQLIIDRLRARRDTEGT